ncbi:hypothetical protein DITRI_Ditri05aG0120600 [Diplodiscus trichospermus]
MPPKRKNLDMGNENASKGNSVLNWSKPMDDTLVDAYLHQDIISNKVGGSFTSHAFDNILKDLKENFPDKPINKDKIKNRMKHIKKNWFPCYDLLKNGMSGFGWDPIAEMFTVELEVWQQLIQCKKSKIDQEVLVLKGGLDNIAQAISSSSTKLVKVATLPILEYEVWNLLVGLNVDEENRYAYYFYLVQKPEMLRVLLGCPWEYRKDLLFQMMKGADAENN